MGSGHFPNEGFGKACCTRQMKIANGTQNWWPSLCFKISYEMTEVVMRPGPLSCSLVDLPSLTSRKIYNKLFQSSNSSAIFVLVFGPKIKI